MDSGAYAEFLSQIKNALANNGHKFDERGGSLVLRKHADPADVYGMLPQHDLFLAAVEEINQGARKRSTLVKIVPKAAGTRGDAAMAIKKELDRPGRKIKLKTRKS